jgi:AraC family ethanolamine operon transcriptional activator
MTRRMDEARRLSESAEGMPEEACGAMEEEIVTRLVRLIAQSSGLQTPRRSRVSHRKVVSRAQDYLLAHPDKVITVTELCETLHVSRRTLQNCFNEVLGICPMSYLKSLRLNAVRRTLKEGMPRGQTVQDVAAANGFWHMSQFAADYRRLFHELPSETLKGGRR